MESSGTLYERVGGRPTLERVHRKFYDRIYAHPWIGQYFRGIDQNQIESQQTDFIAQAMGGPKAYYGNFPIPAHKHMFITPELFDLRHGLLSEAILEAGVPKALAEEWLKIDGAFKGALIKPSLEACEKRFFTDEILAFENPETSRLKAA